MSSKQPYHVVVVVLGDLGRSPRMMYHVESLLQAGYSVTFVGYVGEPLIPSLQQQQQASRTLRVVRFQAPRLKILRTYLLPVYFLWRIVSLTVLLVRALWWHVGTVQIDAILVQNPPAIPLLVVVSIYARVAEAALIIDWHNLGYSMLPNRGIVRAFAKAYEKYLAPYADGHLTVTRTLQDFLRNDMNIISDNMQVLNDCPPALFRLRTRKEQHDVLQRYHNVLTKACPKSWYQHLDSSKDTLFTTQPGKTRYYPRQGRPALIVSSTSWTRDEDMNCLVEAMQLLDAKIRDNNSTLKVYCAMTGKGPLKESYQHQISQLTWNQVAMATLWLEPSDYPQFLACADLGISMHTSTSKMDLPIKILDYFGCEVPTVAYTFSKCLQEVVLDDVNGKVFTTAQDLCDILWNLLSPLPAIQPTPGNHDFGDLQRFSLQIQGRLLWSENWPRHGEPVIARAIRERKRRSTHIES